MSADIGDGAVQWSAEKRARGVIGSTRRAKRSRRLLVWFCLCVGAFVMTLPFLWMLSTSLKVESQIWLFTQRWIPNPMRWQNYVEALTILPFGCSALKPKLNTVIS